MKDTVKKFLSTYGQFSLICLAALLFFLGTSWFNYSTQSTNFNKWLSPDETANYIFTKHYAQTGNLVITEKLNPLVNEIIHPRSFRAEGEQLKPMSFLGIILIYGKIAALTSIKVIPYLTPLFGAIGLIFFYLLISELFDRRVGLLASLMLTFFPPYFYYSSRSMFHNILFMVLLLIGLYYAVMMNKYHGSDKRTEKPTDYLSRTYFFPALAGLFLGLAIITRTSELLWLGPLLLLLWLTNIKATGFIKLALLLSFLAFALLPVFYWNQLLYNSPINTGYPEMNTSITTLTSSSGALIGQAVKGTGQSQFQKEKALFTTIKNTIFYFGLNPHKSFKSFYYYFYKMFAWLFWLAVFGFLLFLTKPKKITKGQIIFILGFLAAGSILLFYYGSWDFHDNPDPKQMTIGNSYTRYWLPIYLGALPFAALLIVRLSHMIKKRFYINAVRIVVIGLITITSVNFVLAYSDESLISSVNNQKNSQLEFNQVLKLTEPDSVIISQYHDKLFYPERRVILGLFDDVNMNKEYAKLANQIPVYYYNFTLPPKDLKYLNDSRLAKIKLRILKIKQITSDFTLYKLKPVK